MGEPETYPDGTIKPTMWNYTPDKDRLKKLEDLNSGLDDLSKELGIDLDDSKEVDVRPPGYIGPEKAEDKELVDRKSLRQVKMPSNIEGLTWRIWVRLVNNASMLARLGERVDADALKKICPDLTYGLITAVLGCDEFATVLEYRGVIDEHSPIGLTERQLMALNALSNFTDKRTIRNKLRGIGVSDSEFAQWNSANTRFKRMFRKLSEQMFDEAQAAVNVATITGAVDGDIRFIKYFNEMTGRWDPNTKQVMDVQELLRGITEIITSTITDPDLLRQIGGKFAVLMGSLSGGSNSTVIEDNVPEITTAPRKYDTVSAGFGLGD